VAGLEHRRDGGASAVTGARTALAAAIIALDADAPRGGRRDGVLAIVADRRLSLAALSALLLRNPKHRVVHESRGVAEVHETLAAFRPAVVVVDRTGVGASFSIDASEWNGRTLLLLDPEDDPAVIMQAIRSRAHGYLSRTASREAFEEAVESLRKTDFYLDPLLIGKILVAMRELRSPAVTSSAELSQREREILLRIASGWSTKEVAREYAITPKTVGNHINHIYQKLKLNHRGELVLYAVQEGLTG
jgi:DNA-binding NarL/FixJ family response regulator